MDDISTLETFFRAEVLTVAEVVALIGAELFNSLAPATAVEPYAVFTVTPLDDKTGQARTSIQTRALIDLKFVCRFPLPSGLGDAVENVKEHFRNSQTYTFGGCRISIRHERPISYMETGDAADDKVMNRGSTFRAWLSKAVDP